MVQKKFVETFGGIFEKSPWIAEKTWDTELGPAHDTVHGLHSAFCRIFRAEEKEIRLEVLKAHPELAVKLSKSERLTKESQNEQASAGLDNLTSEEYEQFNELNRSYREKYGFPFIIAVKNRSKSEILDNFISRIKNTEEMEFNEACAQVERIAEIRLLDII
jgi:OHCU decarboxylase